MYIQCLMLHVLRHHANDGTRVSSLLCTALTDPASFITSSRASTPLSARLVATFGPTRVGADKAALELLLGVRVRLSPFRTLRDLKGSKRCSRVIFKAGPAELTV